VHKTPVEGWLGGHPVLDGFPGKHTAISVQQGTWQVKLNSGGFVGFFKFFLGL
jgi:hypothetical protein